MRETNQAGERDRRLVDLAHEQPLQYHSIELASRPSYEKTVQLIIEPTAIYIQNKQKPRGIISMEERERERMP